MTEQDTADTPAQVAEQLAQHVQEQETSTTATVTPEPVAAPAPQSAEQHPDRWGRVDEDGTVYVTTLDGERAVGSWQAGEPAEGLAHFARRFDDLRTEAELLFSRLAAGHGDPKHALTSAKHLRESLTEAAVVGDLVALCARCDYVIAKAEQAVQAGKQARDAARAEAVARKQALVSEAEKIADEATQWKVAGDRLREILDEWKAIKGVDRKTDEVLWKRFAKARDTFNRRRGSHFADLDRTRAAARTRKEELVDEADAIDPTGGLEAARAALHRIQDQWDQVGKVPRERVRELDGKLRAIEERVRSAADAQWRRADPEAEARAAQFRQRVEQFEAQATKARAAGDRRRAEQAEA